VCAEQEHDSRQFMWQLALSGHYYNSPKTAPPDHDVNELGHRVGKANIN